MEALLNNDCWNHRPIHDMPGVLFSYTKASTWENDQGKEGRERDGKGIKIYYGHVSSPPKECKHVLQTRTN